MGGCMPGVGCFGTRGGGMGILAMGQKRAGGGGGMNCNPIIQPVANGMNCHPVIQPGHSSSKLQLG